MIKKINVNGEEYEIGAVKTVNGKSPDENGNINVANGSGLTSEIKNALIECFRNVAWINDRGAELLQNLIEAFDASEEDKYLVEIVASYEGGRVPVGTLTDDLGIVVIGRYNDGSTIELSNYTISPDTIAQGENIITITYGNFSTTVNVYSEEYSGDVEVDFADGLFEALEIVEGQALDRDTGEAYESSNAYYATEYLRVNNSGIICRAPSVGTFVRVFEYDANHNFIKCVSFNNYTTTKAISDVFDNEVKFIRLSWTGSKLLDIYLYQNFESVMFEKGDVSASTGEDIEQQYRVRSVDYFEVSSTTAYFTPCPIGGGDLPVNGVTVLRCFDENKNIIGSSSVSSYPNFTLPTGTKYVRLVMQKSGSVTTTLDDVVYPFMFGDKVYKFNPQGV